MRAIQELTRKDMEVNINQLRVEEYADETRIPTIASAPPDQDAHRRDITINSLFYNISTSTDSWLIGSGVL